VALGDCRAHLYLREPSETRPDRGAAPRGICEPRAIERRLCHQVTTLDRAKLTERVGTLPVDLLDHVDEALRAALDLD